MNKKDFQRRWLSLQLLQWPGFIWLAFFLLGPLVFIFCVSLAQRSTYGAIDWSLSFSSYLRILQPVYFKIFFKSFSLSMMTTFLCLILAYPTAWAIATAPVQKRMLLIFLISVPFLMNLIIRIYALRLFFGFDGPVAQLVEFLGLPVDPFSLSQNIYLVFYGMISTYLPFMVFPILAALEKFDFTLLEASYDLGARPLTTLWQVIVPGTRAGLANGCLLVFVPCLGEFVIPDLLGGAKSMLLGNLITEQFLKSRDWPFGAALSSVLILIITVFAFMIQRWGNRKVDRRQGATSEH